MFNVDLKQKIMKCNDVERKWQDCTHKQIIWTSECTECFTKSVMKCSWKYKYWWSLSFSLCPSSFWCVGCVECCALERGRGSLWVLSHICLLLLLFCKTCTWFVRYHHRHTVDHMVANSRCSLLCHVVSGDTVHRRVDVVHPHTVSGLEFVGPSVVSSHV